LIANNYKIQSAAKRNEETERWNGKEAKIKCAGCFFLLAAKEVGSILLFLFMVLHIYMSSLMKKVCLFLFVPCLRPTNHHPGAIEGKEPIETRVMRRFSSEEEREEERERKGVDGKERTPDRITNHHLKMTSYHCARHNTNIATADANPPTNNPLRPPTHPSTLRRVTVPSALAHPSSRPYSWGAHAIELTEEPLPCCLLKREGWKE
jgi:hypothetical protein